MLDRQNHATGGANGSIMVGMFVCLCLPSKKPSEREFFVPAETDLGVKLLKNLSNRSMAASTKPYARPLTPRAAWIHQIHAAGGVGRSNTMVVVFVVWLCCVLRLVWSSSLAV
jgi:hypothetical protein